MDKKIYSAALHVLLCVACSNANEAPDDNGDAATGQGGDTSAARQSTVSTQKGSGIEASDGAELSDWHTLVEGAWELPGGEEGYRCVRLTASEDLYVKEFHPIAPPGTHHTLLGVTEEPTEPDGISACGPNDSGHVTLLGSGVGENYSAGPLPAGVAYKIPRGAQLILNLHLFNLQDEALEGVSGVHIRTTTADRVEQLAQVTLAGPMMFSLPSGTSKTQGVCTLRSDATLFALSPHMHQLGRHLKAVAKPASGAPIMLYDGAFDFNEQRQYPANMVALKAGDAVEVECTFENTTDHAVNAGPSSLDEMCFIGLYRFPLVTEELICSH